jgi:cell division septal protein FtsQ
MMTEAKLSRLYSRKQRFPMNKQRNRKTSRFFIAFYFVVILFYTTLLWIFIKLT